MTFQHTTDAYNRAVDASAAIFTKDGDLIAHDERVAAVKAIMFGAGLDLGQVARGPARHGDPEWSFRPTPPSRDAVSAQCLAFLKREKIV